MRAHRLAVTKIVVALEISLEALPRFARRAHRLEPDRRYGAQRRFDRRRRRNVLHARCAPLRSTSGLLGRQADDAVLFQSFEQGQTGLDLLLAVGRSPVEMRAQRAREFLARKVLESLDRLLHLRKLLAGESASAKRRARQAID